MRRLNVAGWMAIASAVSITCSAPLMAQATSVPIIETPTAMITPVSAPGAPTAAPAPNAAPTASAAKATSAKARECTRLPLSDIQVGKEKTIEVARLRLDEYAAKVGKQRGWKSWDKSLETTSCEDYLFVPLLGQEYKCLVTATFCKKS
jgi:hypothetical protein